jgi:hypothetical protein
MKKKQQGWTDKEMSDNKIVELEKEISNDFSLSLALEIQAAKNLLENLKVFNAMKPSQELTNARIHITMALLELQRIKID